MSDLVAPILSNDPYVDYDLPGDEFILDGAFTLDDLRKIIAFLEAKNG